jgi:polar amino acid transport system substrate-binding protein
MGFAWLLPGLLTLGAQMPALTTSAAPTEVRARGVLRWGADPQGGAPYVFQDPMDPNHLIGFEVELADALAARWGLRARAVPGAYDLLLDLLRRGDFEIALNGMERAEEKRRVVTLSRTYYRAQERLTLRRDDALDPTDLDALKGMAVGTLPGTLAERMLRRAGADVRTYPGGQEDMFQDLVVGRTRAVLTDGPITHYYADPDRRVRVSPRSFGQVEYVIASRQSDPELAAAINEGLAALEADGTLGRILQRWDLAPESNGPHPAWDSWRQATQTHVPFFRRVGGYAFDTVRVFARGAVMTLAVSLASMALAMTLGLLLALARSMGPAPLRALAAGWVELVRGTPLLVQITMVYFGLPELGLTLRPAIAGIAALGINYAAAESENYRAGLSAVPAGQWEAARILGLNRVQTLWRVVGPQALRVALPPVTNDFIALLKDSSLVALVTLTELTKSYLDLSSARRDHLGLGLLVAIWYLLLGLPFARLSRWAEARLSPHERRVE